MTKKRKLKLADISIIYAGQGNYTREDWRTRYGNYLKACESLPGFNTTFRPLPLELWVDEGEPESLSNSAKEFRWWIKYLINK